MQSNQNSQFSIKDYCIGEKIPKQSGQKRDSSQKSSPEDIQLMKKMDHENNANDKSNPSNEIKDEDVTIQFIWNELKTEGTKRKQCISS